MMPFLNESNTNPEAQAKTLCITNIPTTASDKEISAIYEKYGKVLKISLLKARNNTQYAFVEFAKPSEAQAAFLDRFNIFLNGHKIYTEYRKNNSK
jgi:RNA recognition motif-containing protein